MAHRVKCFYCGETFDTDKEESVKPRVNRYAHKLCYDKNHNPDDDYIEKIYSLIKKVFGDNYDYTPIERQRKSYLAKGMTNEGIYNSIYYWFIVNEESVEKANGRIGIVPHIYEDAQKYAASIGEAEKKFKKAFTQEQEKMVVDITKLENGNKKKTKKIDMSSLI